MKITNTATKNQIKQNNILNNDKKVGQLVKILKNRIEIGY